MEHEEIKQAIKERKTLTWNDPDPIEGNDYTIDTIKLDKDTETALITYGGGSEAEVYYSEISVK